MWVLGGILFFITGAGTSRKHSTHDLNRIISLRLTLDFFKIKSFGMNTDFFSLKATFTEHLNNIL